MNEREWLTGRCPYCGHDVPAAPFPWLHARHDIHGNGGNGGASVCPGSRNVFTLDVLGLRELEPEHVPPVRGAA